MNAPNTWLYDDEMEPSYSVSSPRRDQAREQRMRRHSFERRAARPSSLNGIHRRRNKRFSW
jgi:hypothetical protein